MRRLAPIALALLALSATPSFSEPRLTESQVERIVAIVKEHEKIKGSSPIPPAYDIADGTWTSLLSQGFPGGDTFIIVRDSDGAYIVMTSGARGVPKFKISSAVRRKIRLVMREPKPKT